MELNELCDNGNTLHIRVTAKAAHNTIKIESNLDGTKSIRIYVTTVAENGKANKEVIKLLAKTFRLPKSAFTIVRGIKSKYKVIQINSKI